jgi:hypothetical protein
MRSAPPLSEVCFNFLLASNKDLKWLRVSLLQSQRGSRQGIAPEQPDLLRVHSTAPNGFGGSAISFSVVRTASRSRCSLTI